MVQCVADPGFLARGEHEMLARLAKKIDRFPFRKAVFHGELEVFDRRLRIFIHGIGAG